MFARERYWVCVLVATTAILALPPAFAQEADETLDELLYGDDDISESQPEGDNVSEENASSETLEPTPVGQTDNASTVSRPRSRVVEEIVVTAQRREESIQDVPISVSAFSSEKLDALGVETAQDLQLATPGLVYSNSAIHYALIYIRGIGTDVFIPSADSSVATYLDGVYFPYAHGLAGSFTEIERVEVLKGPQGTLFGRNTTGGAINIITRTPSDQFEAKLSAKIGDYNKRVIRGYTSVPITDKLAASFAGVYVDEDSFYTASAESPVQTQPFKEDKGGHLKLYYQATDEISLELSGLSTRSSATLLNSIEDTKLAGQLFRPRDTRPYEYESNVDGLLNSDNDVLYGSINWRTDALNVKLFGSQQDVAGSTLYDFDGGPNGGVYFDVPDEFVEAKSAELQFQSVPGGLFTFSDRLNWTMGYYYFDSIGGYGNVYFGLLDRNGLNLTDPTGSDLSILDVLNIPIPAGLDLPLPDVPLNAEVKEEGTVDTRSHALYGQATWEVTDWFGLTLGGRYQREERGTVTAASYLATSRTPEGEIPLFVHPLESRKSSNFSPKVTLDFKPFADDTMVYTTWQKGFKSGTFNVVSLNNPPAYVEPEEVTSIELGIKGYAFDGAMSYGAAVFNNNIKNLQTLAISLTSGGTSQLLNAGEATIQGMDFDVTWQMFPDALPGFALTLSGAYLDGEYDSFPNGAGFLQEPPETYCGPGAQFSALCDAEEFDFTGNTTVRTPKYSGNLGLSQSLVVPGGELELGVNVNYNDGFFFDTQNTTVQPEYTLVNARISYLFERHNLRLTAFAQNLTDEIYYSDKLIVDFGTNAYLAPPRTYSLSLAWEFDG